MKLRRRIAFPEVQDSALYRFKLATEKISACGG